MPKPVKTLTPYWNQQCSGNVSQMFGEGAGLALAEASKLLASAKPISKGNTWCDIASIDMAYTGWLSKQFEAQQAELKQFTRSCTIQLDPTPEQKYKLRQWFGAYRWAYNQTVQYCGEGPFSYMKMRKEWKARMLEVAPWITEIPAHTIYGAMMDAAKDYAEYVKRSKYEEVSKPKCKYRKQRSFYILGNAIQPNGIYPRLLGPMSSSEPLPNKPKDSRILYINRKWYLRVPVIVNSTVPESQGRVVSIDPGVRTFLTCFSDRGVAKIGEGQFNRIFRLLLSADELKGKISKFTGKRKYRAKLAFSRMLERIKNLVDDMHYQSASWLVDNYDVIIFPEANFTCAVEKSKRKIRSKVVRSLMGWSFARFRDRLRDKCELTGKRFVLQEESYTSKTANWTGEVKEIGGGRYIVSGGIKVDRDINGALGIMLKALLAQPALKNVEFVN